MPDKPRCDNPAVTDSAVNPNGAFLLSQACPTGHHVGSVHAHLTSDRITIDRPPLYLCGCQERDRQRRGGLLSERVGSDWLRGRPC